MLILSQPLSLALMQYGGRDERGGKERGEGEREEGKGIDS